MKVLIVSTALDTNAQNYRFHKAAERWGTDPDVLKALVVGQYDPANVGNRYALAAEKLGSLAIRSAHVAEAYFDFPRDIRWTRSTHAEVQRLADECDVIHLNNSYRAYTKLKMPRVRKPALLHHHGSLLRNHGASLLSEAKRFNMVQAVSTVDLLRYAPEAHWLPTAYDLDELAQIGKDNRRPADGMVRIVSCPTNAEYKSTALLEAAVRELQAEGLPVELVLVLGRPWAECLRIKATADIYFDQIAVPKIDYPGGYGCNAIEAWGMGIPVVAGADEWTTVRMRQEWNTDSLPFAEATDSTTVDVLRSLVQSPDLRATYTAIGMAHVQRYHAEKPALARLAELYGMAITKQVAAIETGETWDEYAPGTFRTELAKLSVSMGNQQHRFIEQQLTLHDPRQAQKMRSIAKARKRYLITEVPYEQAEDAA
jgi:hypothetical protein